MIPVNQPLLSNREKELLVECIDTGWISSDGPFVRKFEEKFSSFIGADHGIAVSNGTAALETALFAARIGKNDEIIMPAFTIISCIYPVIRNKLKPILVDSDIKNWNLDIDLLKKKITPKTKCIIAPHIYGLPVDMSPLMKIAKEKKIYVIEDTAEAIGLDYNGKKCGSFGDLSTFSFYANKHITTGEGGMILTDNREAMWELKKMSYDGREPDIPWRDQNIQSMGYHYYMAPETAMNGLKKFPDAIKNKPKQWLVSDYPDLTRMEIFKNG